MTVSKLYYGPNISIVENITRDSKNIIYDKNYGLCQYSSSKGYLKNNIFTWKFPKNCYEIVEKENYNIKLKCRTLTGKLLIFDISSVSTVYDIKGNIHKELGTPHDQQRLIFRGIQLEDKQLCANYFEKSDNDYTISLVCRLRGGMMHQSSGKGDNHNMSSVNIMINNNTCFKINFEETISKKDVEERIEKYLSSLEGIVDAFEKINPDNSSKYKHVLMSEDILRKDSRVLKLLESAEKSHDSEWVDVITKMQKLLLKKYGFSVSELSEYQKSSQKHPECCFWVRENKSGPCKVSSDNIIPNINLSDLSGNDINLISETKNPLVVVSGSIS